MYFVIKKNFTYVFVYVFIKINTEKKVSFIYLQYFERYAPDKLTTAKIRKGNNSVLLMFLALCTSPDDHLSLYQV